MTFKKDTFLGGFAEDYCLKSFSRETGETSWCSGLPFNVEGVLPAFVLNKGDEGAAILSCIDSLRRGFSNGVDWENCLKGGGME